jgi:hypothetical protein
MNPISLSCARASSGTGTAGPNWPLDRMASSIAGIPASIAAHSSGSRSTS